MKRLAITLLLSVAMTTPCFANAAHDQAMSYILADQDKPTKAGDKFYSEGITEFPVLMETTGYCHGKIGSHGDRMKEGMCAASPEMYGDVVMVYEAIAQEDGSYSVGEYLDTLEIRDTGYGYSTGQGKSRVRSDKKYQGTIEKGIHIDVYYPDKAGCKEWMQRTGGKVFAVVIEGKG